MDPHASAGKTPDALMWIAGAAVIVFAGAAMVIVMGRVPVAAMPPIAITICAECGVIESTREVGSLGESSGLGAAGGAVAGGLIGSQLGVGEGRKAMAAAGAVGGAIAGDAVEKEIRGAKLYEITVRFEDGSSRVITGTKPPAWRRGDRVRVVNGAIRSNA